MSIEIFEKLNVLYVEDEEDVNVEVVNNLKFFVNNIISCKNGQEGLAAFLKEEEKIDLIITDVLMPILDGKKMVDKIRLINKEIPIIYTTAFNNEEFKDYTAGQDYIENISKPIDLEELFKCISKLISK